jgi:hypothetical protein
MTVSFEEFSPTHDFFDYARVRTIRFRFVPNCAQAGLIGATR